MASLQAKHSRQCGLGRAWTPFKNAPIGCTCPQGPVYYVVVREGRKAYKERVGRNRRDAERALRKIAVSVDDGAYRPQENIGFLDWADRWLASLERKPSTVDSYRSTINLAKEVFMNKRVRRLGPEDITRFNEIMRAKGASTSTRAKHLRVLGACLQAAFRHRYAAANPVRELHPAMKPRPERKEAAYFENTELPRLFAELDEGPYRTVCLAALKTGMRQGELLGLCWGDVDLRDAVIRVRRTYTGGTLGTPKNRERRDVDLTSEVVELLGWWWGECGRTADSDTLVFPGTGKTGYLSSSALLNAQLYPAMERAGIPRVGPTGEKRTFHSFRHTFAKRALETGAQITWLSRHLGHSSLKVTTDIYGHWERAERKLQAAKMEGAPGSRRISPLRAQGSARRTARGLDRWRSGDCGLRVRSTADRLGQIVDNLVANALAVSDTVVVSTLSEDGWIELHVVDHGPGLTADERERAFDRFWRGRTAGPGSGLGLPIVRRLARVDGGDAELRPAPGGGIDAAVRLRPS